MTLETAIPLRNISRQISRTKDAVLVIHTKNNGEISEASTGKNKDEPDRLRKLSREIDNPTNKYKAVVSVMVLREGWDVRNVTAIVGLRPFTAEAEILPEQTLGRGLRRMFPDRDVAERLVYWHPSSSNLLSRSRAKVLTSNTKRWGLVLLRRVP